MSSATNTTGRRLAQAFAASIVTIAAMTAGTEAAYAGAIHPACTPDGAVSFTSGAVAIHDHPDIWDVVVNAVTVNGSPATAHQTAHDAWTIDGNVEAGSVVDVTFEEVRNTSDGADYWTSGPITRRIIAGACVPTPTTVVATTLAATTTAPPTSIGPVPSTITDPLPTTTAPLPSLPTIPLPLPSPDVLPETGASPVSFVVLAACFWAFGFAARRIARR